MVATGIASLLSPEPKAEHDRRRLGSRLTLSCVHGHAGDAENLRGKLRLGLDPDAGRALEGRGFQEDAFAKVGEIRGLAERLPEKSPIRSVLIDLCARANGDLARFQALLDAWFGTFEDQLTAWYRQKTQYVLVGLSILVAVAMNVDTVDIVRQLSADPNVRKAVVLEAMAAANRESIEAHVDFSPRDKARMRSRRPRQR